MTLLHFFDRLLPGEPAFAGNLLSCLAGGLAVGILGLASMALGAAPEASAVASLSFGLSHLFWGQAVIAEVYSLNIALLGLVLLGSLEAGLRADLRWLSLSFLALGLGLAHHPSIVVPSLPPLILATARCLRAYRLRAFWPVIFAVFGPILYIYLPLRSGAEVAWERIKGLKDFVNYMTLYRGHFLSLPAGEAARRVAIGFGLFPLQFLLLFPPGLRGIFVAERGAKVALLLTITLTILVFANYDVGDVYNFFLPAYAAFVPFVALGLTARRKRITVGASLVGAMAVAYQAWLVFDLVNMRGKTRARDYALEVLRSLPLNSVVLAGCDEVAFSMLYVQRALGKRLDVRVDSCPPVRDLRVERPKNALREGRPVCVLFFEERLFRRHKVEPLRFGWRLLPQRRIIQRGASDSLGKAIPLDVLDTRAKRGECIPAVAGRRPHSGWLVVVAVREGEESRVSAGEVSLRAPFSLGPSLLFFAYVTPVGPRGEVPLWLPDGVLPGVYKIGALEALGEPFELLSQVRDRPKEAMSRVERWAKVVVTAL